MTPMLERCKNKKMNAARVIACWLGLVSGVAGPLASTVGEIQAQPQEQEWELLVANVHNLYGVDVTLTFDASALEVVDTDLQRPGVQISPGPLFTGQAHFVAYNRVTVDQRTGIGTISFVVTLLNPAEPINGGGVVATIRYHLLEPSSPPASTFTIEQAFLASKGGYRMSVEWAGNTIYQVFRLHMPLIARGDGNPAGNRARSICCARRRCAGLTQQACFW